MSPSCTTHRVPAAEMGRHTPPLAQVPLGCARHAVIAVFQVGAGAAAALTPMGAQPFPGVGGVVPTPGTTQLFSQPVMSSHFPEVSVSEPQGLPAHD